MDIFEWLSDEILPHEADLRAWLRSALRGRWEEDDLIQEVYCRLMEVDDPGRIASPRAFLFRIARNVMIDHIRRIRVVNIDISGLIDDLQAPETTHSPETITHNRHMLAKARLAISRLPDRCREVFVLRRLSGLSQREVSARLNISENVVEKETARGIRLVLKGVAEPDENQPKNRQDGEPERSELDRRAGGRMGQQSPRERSQRR